MPYDNEFLLASAGAGKTTQICEYAHTKPSSKILYTTYTHDNTAQLYDTVCLSCGVQPSNVTIMSWFSFLLAECIRPYQHFLYPKYRIENLHFVPFISAKYCSRKDVKRFYLSDDTHIYSDKMSDFAFHCNEASGGLVINRLEHMFDVLIIDEVQDISGYDFNFIEMLLRSRIKVVLVGDTRQKTYSTTQSTKNKRYTNDIYEWFQKMEANGLGAITHLNQSYRCIQPICDFADALFPGLPATKSLNECTTGHDGIFYLEPKDLHEYYKRYNPQILVYNKSAESKAMGYPLRNYGAVKGQTFSRVLIIPTQKIEQYLCSGDINCVASIMEKFYVAITRARFSVAFLTGCTPTLPLTKWDRS